MNKVISRDDHSLVLMALFDDLPRAGINVDIYDLDEMFQLFYWEQGANRESAVAMYLASGRAIWQTLREILLWRFGSLARVGRLLDFASGFGRVTRFMVSEIAPDRIWVSDLQPEAMAAQRQEFGVHTLISAENPADLELPGAFDAIIASSLFTHLPPPRFEEWLEKLATALAPGGVLVLSVHGAELCDRPLRAIEFRPSSESQRLPGESYGSTWVTESFVREAVRAALGETWQVQRFARGLVALQDLYVLTPDRASDPAALRVPRHLDGFVERFDVDVYNRLTVSGWLADRQFRQTGVSLSLQVAGLPVATLESGDFSARTDVQAVLRNDQAPTWGYSLGCRLEQDWDPSAVVELWCRFADGQTVSVLSGTLGSALLRGARVAIIHKDNRVREVERALADATERVTSTLARAADLERELVQSSARAAELEARVRWMEASRFWRLRNRWFRLKRLLRL